MYAYFSTHVIYELVAFKVLKLHIYQTCNFLGYPVIFYGYYDHVRARSTLT